MSRWLIVLAGIVGVFILFGTVLAGSLVSTYNGGIRHETGITAQYDQNQNNYSNYFSKLKEVAQVPEMYTEDLSKIYTKVVEGRRGSDQELFRFISENNPNVDASLYRQIQQVIEAGRNSFEADQKTLIDKVRAYRLELGSFPGNLVYGFFGFPKIDFAKYSIVINDETATAFETKRAAPINLREKAPETK